MLYCFCSLASFFITSFAYSVFQPVADLVAAPAQAAAIHLARVLALPPVVMGVILVMHPGLFCNKMK